MMIMEAQLIRFIKKQSHQPAFRQHCRSQSSVGKNLHVEFQLIYILYFIHRTIYSTDRLLSLVGCRTNLLCCNRLTTANRLFKCRQENKLEDTHLLDSHIKIFPKKLENAITTETSAEVNTFIYSKFVASSRLSSSDLNRTGNFCQKMQMKSSVRK